MCRVIESYYRQEHFDFFRGYGNPFYSVTFELEFTRLKEFLDQRGYGIYLNLCYFFTRAMQPLEDFHYRLRDGRIVFYDLIHPGLTVPAANGRFSFANFGYDADTESFNRAASEVMPPPDAAARLVTEEHTNYIYFTAIPGVPFTSFTHATTEPTDTAPRVAFGKFVERSDSLFVSVGLQVNHLFIDGRIVGELVESAQALFNEPS